MHSLLYSIKHSTRVEPKRSKEARMEATIKIASDTKPTVIDILKSKLLTF